MLRQINFPMDNNTMDSVFIDNELHNLVILEGNAIMKRNITRKLSNCKKH